MKNYQFKQIVRRARWLLTIILLLTLGAGQMWAGKNVHWKGNVFFRVPDNWDLSTNGTVQIAVARTTDTNTDTYICYLGTMSRVGSTRLYYIWIDNSEHTSWNQNEYVFFSANDHEYGSGTFKVNGNVCYTTPIDYDFKNASFPYLYNPTSEGNGASVSGSCEGSDSDGKTYDQRREALLKKTQTVNLYTNGEESYAGGSVQIDGIYMTGNTTTGSSNETSGSNTSVSYGSSIGSLVSLTATPTSGYTFVGWFENASGGTAISTNTSYSYTCTGAKTLYARFEQQFYVTVTAGSNGTTTPSSGSTILAGYSYLTGSASATGNNGYYFTNWTLLSGTSAASGYSATSNPIEIHATAASKSITANFAPKWRIIGGNSGSADGDDAMGDWSETANQITSNLTANSGSTSITLNANTTYHFKVLDKSTSTYYSYNGGSQQMVYPTDDGKEWTLYTENANSQIVTAGAGSYTFAWNNSTHKLTVDFPTSYTITYGYGTGGASVAATGSVSGSVATTKYVASGENVTFTQSAASGYTFKEWNTQADGNGEQLGTSESYTISSISANAAVYAIYTPNVYKVRFDLNGGNSFSANGSSSEDGTGKYIDVTYDASLAGLTPPRPVKNGYVFKCWSTDPDDGEGKYLWMEWPFGSGTFAWCNAASYSDYISSTTTWKKANNITLYAQYYRPSFLSVDFSPKYAMPESDITATVSFSPAFGDPEGFYTLCCKLSTKSGTVLQAQPTITHDGVNPFVFTFTAPSSPGEYALQVKLFPGTDNVCGGNSPIATIEGGDLNYFDVEDMNPITITYECGGVELRESTTIYATWNNRATVTAPSIPGMKFDHWEYTNCTIEGGSEGRYNEAEATFYAFTTGSAKAVYTQGSLFFKNTKNWDHVYVYFYRSNYWYTKVSNGESEGTGSNNSWAKGANKVISGPLEMTLLEGTDDVFFYNGEVGENYTAVAFSDESMSNYDYFSKEGTPCQVVYVNAFDANKPMIVPLGGGALWNNSKCRYYAHDLAPLLQDWGATVRSDIDSWVATHKLKSEKMGDLSFSTKIYFDRKSYNQNWRVYDGSGSPYGKNGTPTLTYNSPTSATLINNEGNLLVKTNLPGEYIFTINYDYTQGSGAYDGATATTGLWKCAKVTVTYPVEVGDYQLVYDDSNLNPHPSDIIKKKNNGEAIVSMFYNPNATPVLKIQSCKTVATNLGNDVDPITWNSPTTINLSSYSSVLTEAGVYNFTITLDANGANPAVTNVEKYAGRFYVRTDCVNSDKWNYKDSKDAHAMTYSDYSTTLTDKPYSHYYVKDLHGTSGSPINIRFTVATDYSEAITDTVFAGDVSGDYQDYYGSESLHLTQNVRFTYNQKTNKIWRAYTEGPTNNDYMVLRSGSGLYATKDAPSPTTTFKFADMGNWVYQVDVYSLVNTRVKLTADIHKHTADDNNDSDAADNVRQYLKGKEGNGTDGTEWTGDDAVLLLGGSGESKEHMRITYDFKTDRMTTAWLPSGTVSTDLSIYADVMMLRREQEGATSIVIGTKGEGVYATLSNVEKAYGVMEFRKSYINDISLSRYERNLYWISFPFDVKLSDVFGFGKYGQHWIIEYYDGKGRAQKGYWADSEPNWKYVSEEVKDEFTLKANEGYILALALSNMGNSSSIWTSGSESLSSVYLYFPSSSNIGNITNITSYKMPLDSVGYKCKITRDHRDVKDSYWHCIGVPSYGLNRLTGVSTTVPGNGEDWSIPLPYVYKWDSIYNKLDIASSSTFTFEAMKSYLIQYAYNEIVWANVTNKPQTVVSRNRVEGEDADFYEWKLNLMKDNKRLDHTYVRLSEDENATEGYDFGNDLSKEFNSGANIFTYVDGIEVAGNVMPVVYGQTRTVPVGVKITETGDYTFSMPDGTNGVGVILLDNIAGTRTNLALEDYTVNLATGTYDGRFSLEISPIAQTPTDIEHTSSDSMDGVRKVMVDGVLYIVKDGVVFDACGNRVK